jgi:hypothetical protein
LELGAVFQQALPESISEGKTSSPQVDIKNLPLGTFGLIF